MRMEGEEEGLRDIDLLFDFDNPKNRWRSHRNNFFIQWLRYCYLSISTRDMSNGESLRNRGRIDPDPEMLK